MTWTLRDILSHAVLSLSDPRRAAGELLKWQVPDRAIGPLTLLAVIFLTLATELASAVSTPPPDVQALYVAPLALAMVELVTLVSMALATSIIGQAFGGKGTFKPALIMTAWLHFLGLLYIVPITLIAPFSGFMAELVELAALLYLFWVTLSFIAVLHGFERLGLPFLVVFLSSLVAFAIFWEGLTLFAVPVTTGAVNG